MIDKQEYGSKYIVYPHIKKEDYTEEVINKLSSLKKGVKLKCIKDNFIMYKSTFMDFKDFLDNKDKSIYLYIKNDFYEIINNTFTQININNESGFACWFDLYKGKNYVFNYFEIMD